MGQARLNTRTLKQTAAVLLGLGLLGACSSHQAPNPYAGGVSYPWSDRLEAGGPNPYAAGHDYAWTGVRTAGRSGVGGLGAQALSSGQNFLSDLSYTSATNGWGPVERDRSNGEQGPGDGAPLRIGTQTFAKGLGVHASSELRYTLTSSCSALSATIGLDEEIGDRGSVNFQVFSGPAKLFDSGVVRGADAPRAISVPLGGVTDLRLVVTGGGDNIDYDHADWGAAAVQCDAPPPPSNTKAVSELSPTSSSNGWGPFERNQSNGEQGAGDGRPLTLNGVSYATGLGVHAGSSLTYALGGGCTVFTAQIGVDDEVGERGSVVFQVYGDAPAPLYDSGVMTGASATKSVSVDLSGQQNLRLAVTNGGDNVDYDHADWGEAAVACAPPTATSQYIYSPIAGQPQGVSEAQGEVVGGQLYVFGGFDDLKSCCTPTNRAQRYDPGLNRWTALAPMPDRGVTHAGMTTDGSDIYYAGGYGANSTWTGQVFGISAVWRYNVARGDYTRLPDLPVPSAAGQLDFLGGKLHYFGGTNPERTRDLNTHYVLNLAAGAAGWVSAAPLSVARNHLGSAVLDGRIYAVGGQTGHDQRLVTVSAVEVYDPAADRWTTLAPLPQARSHVSNSTFAQGGRIVVMGGETVDGVASATVTAFDPTSGTWAALTPLPQARVSGVAGAIDNDFIFTGGNSLASGWRASPAAPR